MPNHNHPYLLFNKKFLRNFRVDGLFGVYLDTALIYLGMSLVGIFVPLYVLKLTGSILAVFGAYAFYHLIVIIFSFPTAFLIKKIGIDRTAFFGAISRVLFLLFLILAKKNTLLLWPAFFFYGLTIPLCWLPFHFTTINIDGGDKKFGKEMGIIGLINRLFSSLGPVLGGFIIAFLNFSWLYGLAIIINFLSGIALFFDKFEKKGMEIDVKVVLRKLFSPKLSGVYNGLFGAGLETAVYSIAWPLFVFLAIGSYQILGVIKSASLFISLLVYYWAGRWVDRKGKGILKIGVVVNSLNLLIRPFLKTALPIFLADSAYLTGAILVWTPFEAAFYEKGFGEKLDYIILRELVLHFSGFVSCLLLLSLFWLRASWWLIFSLAILGLWLTTFIIKKEKDGQRPPGDAIPFTNP